MILVGSQRSGASALASHLMNSRDNDHVTLMELDGFLADDLHGALAEVHAISKGTKCKQYLFSLSLNPPPDQIASEQDFIDAADRIQYKLGLVNQPRAVVIHEKEGRRHAHVVWSRIEADQMKAINLPHYKNRLRDMARELYLDHGWDLPEGLRTYGHANPLNFTLDEWQQALRQGHDPREIKQAMREAWERSDDDKSLKAALEDRGFYLAKGDRRAAVALDINGNVYALARWCGVKSRDVKDRLGDLESLPSLDDIRCNLRSRMTAQTRDYIAAVRGKHQSELEPLRDDLRQMVKAQRDERQLLKDKQAERWTEETKSRMNRVNKGLRGLFDRVTGRAKDVRAQNEREALLGARRDQEQRDNLVLAQMRDRRSILSKAKELKSRQKQERDLLARNIRDYLRRPTFKAQDQTQDRTRERYHGPDLTP